MAFATDASIRKDMVDRIQKAASAMDEFKQKTQAAIDNSDFSKMVEQMRTGPAKLFEQTWKNAVRGAQDSLAQFFMDIGKGGQSLVDLLKSIATEVQSLLAQVLAQQVGNKIFPGLFKFALNAAGGVAGLSDAPSVGNIGDSLPTSAPVFSRAGIVAGLTYPPPRAMRPSQSRTAAAPAAPAAGTTVHVHQNITLNVSALDGPSVDAMLRQRGGTIASVIAQAASDSPAFARHIVANGAR